MVSIEGISFPLSSHSVQKEVCIEDPGFCFDIGNPVLCLDEGRKIDPCPTFDILCLEGESICLDQTSPLYCLDQASPVLCFDIGTQPSNSGDEPCLDGGIDLCFDTPIETPQILPCLDLSGTTSSISQSVRPDFGRSTGISTFTLRVVDRDLKATMLISPTGFTDDLMGKRVQVFMDQEGDVCLSDFPGEFKRIFTGYVCELCSGHGFVDIKLCSTESLTIAPSFRISEMVLTQDVLVADTEATVDLIDVNDDSILPAVPGILSRYVRIADELMSFDDFDPATGTFSGLLREDPEFDRYCDNASEDYEAEESLSVFYRLDGNPLELALQLLLSCPPSDPNPNASPYNVLPTGLCLNEDDVDIATFEELSLENAGVEMCFYITNTIESVRDFIADQLLGPIGLYLQTSEGRISVNNNRPGNACEAQMVLDSTKVTNCSQLKIQRSLSNFYYSEVVFAHTSNPCDSNSTFLAGNVNLSDESAQRFQRENTLTIRSEGLRDFKGAGLISRATASRLLDRYSRGAEFIENIELLFSCACQVNIGDVVQLDLRSLGVSDTRTGRRDTFNRLFEIYRLDVNYKTGRVRISVVDTTFDDDVRLGNIAPSMIVTGISLDPSGAVISGTAEDRFCVGECVEIIEEGTCNLISRSSVASFTEGSVTLTDQVIFNQAPSGRLILQPCSYDMMPDDYNDCFASISFEGEICGDPPYGVS